MNTSSTADKQRRWMQFGLRTLLFIVLCICGLLAGYRVGLYQGAETKRRQSIYAKTFPVGDLTDQVATSNGKVESYDTLIQVIVTNVAPDSWDSVGGPGSISEFPPSKSLVINQTGENHDRIEALLEDLRQNRKLVRATQKSSPKPQMTDDSRFRTWSDPTGVLKLEAEFVEATDGVVKLRLKKDGKIVEVPVDRLSKEDQKFLGAP